MYKPMIDYGLVATMIWIIAWLYVTWKYDCKVTTRKGIRALIIRIKGIERDGRIK